MSCAEALAEAYRFCVETARGRRFEESEAYWGFLEKIKERDRELVMTDLDEQPAFRSRLPDW